MGKKWIKNNPDKKQKFLFYAVNQIVAITSSLAKASNDVMVTTRVLTKQWNAVPTKYYKVADKVLKSTLAEMTEIFLNRRGVPGTTIWNNSKTKQKAEKAELNKVVGAVRDTLGGQPKRELGNRGPGRDDLRADPKITKRELTGDKKGFIKSEGTSCFQVPKELHNEDFKLYKAFALDGVECEFGRNCRFALPGWMRLMSVVLDAWSSLWMQTHNSASSISATSF